MAVQLVTPIDALFIALAAWYVAYVVTKPTLAGPFGLLTWFRTHVTLGGLTQCITCLIPWVAGAMYLLWQTPLQHIVVVLALGSGGLMLATFSGVQHG